jgi:hypothetical protein
LFFPNWQIFPGKNTVDTEKALLPQNRHLTKLNQQTSIHSYSSWEVLYTQIGTFATQWAFLCTIIFVWCSLF